MTNHVLRLRANRHKLVEVTVEESEKSLHLYFDYNAALVDEARCMVGATWDKANTRWRVANCRRNWMQLELLQGITPPELSRYLAKSPLLTEEQGLDLWAHQRPLVAQALHRRRVVWAAEMATGKTRAAERVMSLVGGRWWYVAPKRVLDAVRLEFYKWKSKVKPEWVSYHALVGLIANWPPGQKAPAGVVFDESSRLKNPDAGWTIAAQHLANAVREEHDGYVIEMTGTPAPQDPVDWWSQTEVACPGWLRESSAYHLRKRLGEYEMVQMGGRTFPKLKRWKDDQVKLLAQRLAGVVHVVRLADTELSLPPPRYERVQLSVTPEFERAALAIASLASSAMELLGKLRQLSDGFLYETKVEDGKTVDTVRRSPTPKDAALAEILERHEEAGRLLVYAGFRESVDRCVEVANAQGWPVLRLDGRGWAWFPVKGAPQHHGDDDLAVRSQLMALQRGGDSDDRLCFVGQPGAGGMGQNFQGSPAIVFYSNDFNNESRQQAERRALRPGMDVRRGLVIYDLLHLGTDEHVLNRLVAKQQVQLVTVAEIRKALTR
jgi:hypothetical protein